MNDAGSEAKRETDRSTPPNTSLKASLGDYEARVRAALAEADGNSVIERIWNKDATVWTQSPAHQEVINNSLGWLTVVSEMLAVTGKLRSFAEEIRASGEFQHVMVCGMGGSSLCPEVLRQTFGRQESFPELLVLDSTDPDAVNSFKQQIDVGKCLFVIASKSGTTTEPLAFHRYWYHEVAKLSPEPGKSFVTITDPGSPMADTATVTEDFRRIFLNQADIGGRYSALSYFGMVPAALMGLDLERLLREAATMGDVCRARAATDDNPAATLGAVMAECALAGRDKLTIVTDQKLSALGLWVEQLIAESTGKEGKGIIPIVGEPLGPPAAYASDRVFVSIAVGEVAAETQSKLQALEAAGHPVVYRTLGDVYELGAEFFLWELATAFAGWRLGINPFDQPNVQESKDATKALLAAFERDGKLPAQSSVASDDQLTVYTGEVDGAQGSSSVREVLRAHCAKVKPGDYIALLAYLEETPEIEAELQTIRTRLRDATRCATTTGYGPRFLHSTGQLHKGGPDSGVFIQITAPDKADFWVPGKVYPFSVLKDAQALGDLESLLKHGRRAIRVDLGGDVLIGLTKLRELIEAQWSVASGQWSVTSDEVMSDE